MKKLKSSAKTGDVNAVCALPRHARNHPVVLPGKLLYLPDVDRNGSQLMMLKRFSSLILALLIGGSVFAGPALGHDEHVCQMPGMEEMPGMAAMPCCKHETPIVVSEPGPRGQCCVTIPQGPGSSGTTFNLRPPSFNLAVIHPAAVQPPMTAPEPYVCSPSTQVFLPNLQASYIRHLSLLI